VFPSISVEDWIDERGTRPKPKRKQFFSVMQAVVDALERRNGKPDNRLLFREGDDGLCAARCDLGDEGRWAISYYVAADGRILLLTVFRITNADSFFDEIRKAREAMERSKDYGDDIDRV
jgi:hypothetical protein